MAGFTGQLNLADISEFLAQLLTDLETQKLHRYVYFDVCTHRGDAALKTVADELVSASVEIVAVECSLGFVRDLERFCEIPTRRVVNPGY
jgi:hypothetical protein